MEGWAMSREIISTSPGGVLGIGFHSLEKGGKNISRGHLRKGLFRRILSQHERRCTSGREIVCMPSFPCFPIDDPQR
jgi:hypothetical protein